MLECKQAHAAPMVTRKHETTDITSTLFDAAPSPAGEVTTERWRPNLIDYDDIFDIPVLALLAGKKRAEAWLPRATFNDI